MYVAGPIRYIINNAIMKLTHDTSVPIVPGSNRIKTITRIAQGTNENRNRNILDNLNIVNIYVTWFCSVLVGFDGVSYECY